MIHFYQGPHAGIRSMPEWKKKKLAFRVDAVPPPPPPDLGNCDECMGAIERKKLHRGLCKPCRRDKRDNK